MKKHLSWMLMAACLFSAVWAADPGEELFAKAKTLIFDKEWAAALKNLDEIIARYGESRQYATALFYRGKCQEELGASRDALASYEAFVAAAPANNLAEEALVSVIDLAAALHQAGDKGSLRKIMALLGHGNKVVSYYAAFKLSYLTDRAGASRALPVLEGILAREKDEELRDRAKIAIMRIDPARLKKLERPSGKPAGTMLRIRVAGRGDGGDKFSLSIPLALADLALKSLGAEEKRALKKEGYDVERLLEQLVDKGMRINIQDEESTIQIWIE
jgi:tetratricopeptide (TPR) repeat protein